MRITKLLYFFFFLLASKAWGTTLFEQWSKAPPGQHFVTADSSATDIRTLKAPEQEASPNYEDLVVFSLKATIAAFHVNPKTFSQDMARLKKYFKPHAIDQINQKLFPGSGSGLLDHCIVTQSACNAITRAPVIIEVEKPHYYQIRLPLVLHNQQKVDAILSIERSTGALLMITDFEYEDVT